MQQACLSILHPAPPRPGLPTQHCAMGMPMSCQTAVAATTLARVVRKKKKSAIAWQLAGKDPQKWSTSMGIYKKCKFIRAAVVRGVEFWLKCWLKKVDKENEKVREREREREPTSTNFDWRPSALSVVNVSGKASKVQRHCIFFCFCFCFLVFSFYSSSATPSRSPWLEFSATSLGNYKKAAERKKKVKRNMWTTADRQEMQPKQCSEREKERMESES